MQRLLVVLVFGTSLFGCKAQSNLQSQDIDTRRILEAKGITFWFDVYDPISYTINLENDSLTIVLYTHHVKNEEVHSKQIKSTDSPSIELIKNLDFGKYKKCEDLSAEYTCLGLDGSEVWVQFQKNGEPVTRKYWSPEDQLSTQLGMNLVSLQKELSQNLNIKKLKDDFLSNLKKGKYWNYGVNQLKK
ncbi:MAG: hypothetical protein AAF693_12810 [Bacteroidota bacterium]